LDERYSSVVLALRGGGRAGDATFPRQIFLTSYSVRLGKRLTATDQPPTRPVPAPPTETAPPEPDAAGAREQTPAASAAEPARHNTPEMWGRALPEGRPTQA
jgi:hypothetical protein